MDIRETLLVAEKPKSQEYTRDPDGSFWNPFADPLPEDPEYEDYWMSKGVGMRLSPFFACSDITTHYISQRSVGREPSLAPSPRLTQYSPPSPALGATRRPKK